MLHGLRRMLPFLWRVQGYWLVVLTVMSFFPSWSHVAEDLFVGFLIAAALMAWLDGESLLVRTPIDVPLLLFVGWVLLSVPFATDPFYSLAEWRKLVAKILAFYWAVLVLRHERGKGVTQAVFTAVVGGAAVISLYALAGFLASGGSWRDRLVRAGAPSSDYNWLSTYLVLAIPILAAMALSCRERWQRMTYGIAFGIALLGQVISYTRAGWLGLVVEALAFGWLMGRRKLAVGVLIGSLLLGVGFLAVSKIGYQRVTVSSETLDFRLALWQKGGEEILTHPVFGVGYGNETFTKRYGGHPVRGGPTGLHNMFLMVALGSGIPALVFLVWTLGQACVTLIVRARDHIDGSQAVLMLSVAVMIMGFSVRNFFDYMFAGSVAYLFWIVIAAGLSHVAVRSTACQSGSAR